MRSHLTTQGILFGSGTVGGRFPHGDETVLNASTPPVTRSCCLSDLPAAIRQCAGGCIPSLPALQSLRWMLLFLLNSPAAVQQGETILFASSSAERRHRGGQGAACNSDSGYAAMSKRRSSVTARESVPCTAHN